jgi:hypothetical protein
MKKVIVIVFENGTRQIYNVTNQDTSFLFSLVKEKNVKSMAFGEANPDGVLWEKQFAEVDVI